MNCRVVHGRCTWNGPIREPQSFGQVSRPMGGWTVWPTHTTEIVSAPHRCAALGSRLDKGSEIRGALTLRAHCALLVD